MRERFLDIVTYLARYMFEEGRSVDDEQAVTEELVADGYDPQEVRDAFEWLEQVAAVRVGRPPDRPEAYGSVARVLTPAERLKIPAPAHGFLLRLRQLGIVDAATLERILDRAMDVDVDEIELDDMKALAALVIFDRSPLEVRGHLFDMVEERRERVYH
jgi:Smg protein